MGEHKGWRIKPDKRHGTCAGLVSIPGTGRYRSKSFPTAAEARAWAKAEAAAVAVRGPAAAPEDVLGGRTPVAALAKDYTAGLVARGRSPSHLANVRRTLDGLAAVAPDLADRGAGRAIETWIHGLDVAPASRNRTLVEVRGFCRWLIRRDLLAKDPTRVMDRVSVPEYLREQFTIAELWRLLALPTPDPAYHRRLALMAYAGLRSDEAAALTWADVDVPGRVLLIRMHAGRRLKRNRERVVPLHGELAAMLTPAGATTAQVAPIPDRNDRRSFARYLTACGVPLGKRSPHSCRHTYAGLMTATGVPGPLLSAYLGHSSAATTMLYTKLAARHVAAVAGWPRGEFRLFTS